MIRVKFLAEFWSVVRIQAAVGHKWLEYKQLTKIRSKFDQNQNSIKIRSKSKSKNSEEKKGVKSTGSMKPLATSTTRRLAGLASKVSLKSSAFIFQNATHAIFWVWYRFFRMPRRQYFDFDNIKLFITRFTYFEEPISWKLWREQIYFNTFCDRRFEMINLVNKMRLFFEEGKIFSRGKMHFISVIWVYNLH